MNSKKLVAMGLALILALSLCACAANEPAGTTEGIRCSTDGGKRNPPPPPL